MKYISLFIFTIWTLTLYGQNESHMNIEKIKLCQQSIDYPYVASKQRNTVILENMNMLKKGMTIDQTIALLTNPDEVNLTYKFKKAKFEEDNVIGFSVVYLLRRDTEKGSVVEKNEQLLRIHFNDSEKLIWSYSTEIDEFREIEK
ncbi:MAG: hypothetical protein AB8F94_08340 [Saprospiraceae bacterium]